MQAKVEIPTLILPVRPGMPGAPTAKQARGRRWRRTARGLVVPAEPPSTVEQRIAEVGGTLPLGGMVTGWAALRLLGAGWFDGFDRSGRVAQPVPVRMPHGSRVATPGAVIRRARYACGVRLVQGVVCADPETAVLDAMESAADDREAVVVLDMAMAAELTSRRRIRAALDRDPRRRLRRRTLHAIDLADERSASPQESRLRLVWMLDAGAPRPLLNVDLETLSGDFICRPDLLDLRLGVCGEYDGAEHRTRERHRSDEERIERSREAGLERFTVVAGDSVETQVRRMRAAIARAEARIAEPRRWRVRPIRGFSLDDRLDFYDSWD